MRTSNEAYALNLENDKYVFRIIAEWYSGNRAEYGFA